MLMRKATSGRVVPYSLGLGCVLAVVVQMACTTPDHASRLDSHPSTTANVAQDGIDKGEAIEIARRFLEDRYGPGHYTDYEATYLESSEQWFVVARGPVDDNDLVFSGQGAKVIIDRHGNPRLSPGR
jgi:hypothetical protein